METELIENSIVELTDVKDVLSRYDIDENIQNSILEDLSKHSQTLKEVLEDPTDSSSNEELKEIDSEKESIPRVKKQWGILVSDPEHTINKEYMGWVFQMNEDDNIADATDKIITAAAAFNRSKKGARNPVKTIGEACMFVPGKFFKEQNIYVKSKEPIYINITDNTLVSQNA